MCCPCGCLFSGWGAAIATASGTSLPSWPMRLRSALVVVVVVALNGFDWHRHGPPDAVGVDLAGVDGAPQAPQFRQLGGCGRAWSGVPGIRPGADAQYRQLRLRARRRLGETPASGGDAGVAAALGMRHLSGPPPHQRSQRCLPLWCPRGSLAESLSQEIYRWKASK